MQSIATSTDATSGARSARPGQGIAELDEAPCRIRAASGRRPNDIGDVRPDAVVASSRDLGWRNVRVLKTRHDGGALDVPPLEYHAVVVHLRPSVRVRGRVGARELDEPVRPGKMTVVPAGDEVRWRWDADRSVHALHVYLHPSFLRSAAVACGLDPNLVVVEARPGVRDAQIRHLALALLHELEETNVVGSPYAESLATAIAMRLVRHYSCVRDVRVRKGGMAPGKLRRAVEFVNERLDREDAFSVADVAAAVGLSYYHFFHAFKRSMGSSPNRYVLERRVERAKRMLAETRDPIADISLRVGFASQSHFTTTFRRLTGSTPRVFRATA